MTTNLFKNKNFQIRIGLILASLAPFYSYADPSDSQTDGYDGVDLRSPMRKRYNLSLGQYSEFSDKVSKGTSQILTFSWNGNFTSFGSEGPGRPYIKFLKVKVGLRRDSERIFNQEFGQNFGALGEPHDCNPSTGTPGSNTGSQGGSSGSSSSSSSTGSGAGPSGTVNSTSGSGSGGGKNRFTPPGMSAVGGSDIGWMIDVVPYSLERVSADNKHRSFWKLEMLPFRVSQGFQDPTATTARIDMLSLGGKEEWVMTPKVRATLEAFYNFGWYVISRGGETIINTDQSGLRVKGGVRFIIDPDLMADFTAAVRAEYQGQDDHEAYLRAAITRAHFIQKNDRLEIFLTGGIHKGYTYKNFDRKIPYHTPFEPDAPETNFFSGFGIQYSK